MSHHGPLIATIVAGLVLAFVLGTIAHRVRVSPLVGYLLAGVAVGPFTPGYVADQSIAAELAEIGVILLMFGVGLHFSIRELLAVRWIALPGAVGQMAAATALGMGLAWLLGWPPAGGFVFGLALSVASTVVLLRALQERRLVETDRGRVAVGWLIVEDIAMVLALVVLPAVAGALAGAAIGAGAPEPTTGALAAAESEVRREFGLAGALAITFVKVAGFIAVMLIVGRRIIPWLLHYVAHTGSRELFRLCVLAVALGFAFGAATLFDVSFALGAFFAGMILSESELSQQAAEETLPLRDAFAVLFFVSVGMLFDPGIVLREPGPLLATLAIIMIGKSVAAYAIVRAFGHPPSMGLTISASLAQIGEFSFILAGLGVGLGVLPETGRDLILAGAIISIMLNPLAFSLVDRLRPAVESRPAGIAAEAPAAEESPVDLQPTELTGHAVVIGFGRVGSVVAAGLQHAGHPVLVIEERSEVAHVARDKGMDVRVGNAADPLVLAAAKLAEAKLLLVAVPGAFDAGQVVEQARAANANLTIIARAHSDAEVDYLTGLGANLTIMGEREIARAMLEQALRSGDSP